MVFIKRQNQNSNVNFCHLSNVKVTINYKFIEVGFLLAKRIPYYSKTVNIEENKSIQLLVPQC